MGFLIRPVFTDIMAEMNETTDITLTSSQAALLLRVHESSVKRWSNGGELRSEKTAGGHRRIRFSDLMAFCERQAFDADLLFFKPHEEEVARAALAAREQGDFAGVQELVLRFCDTEAPRWLVKLIRYLNEAVDLPLSRLFDAALGGALGEVGRQWQTGARTIALEHRFTQKVLDALHGLLNAHEDAAETIAPAASPDAVRKPHAIVGCAEACHHEIGSFMARLLLLRAGWTVTYLGANVPYEEIAGIQELERAQLVCIGFAPPLGSVDARRCLKVLNAMRRPSSSYHLVVGGIPSAAGTELPCESTIPVTFATTMERFAQWLDREFPSPENTPGTPLAARMEASA